MNSDFPFYFQSNGAAIPLPAGFADLVVMDPPFGINFNGRSSAYNRTKSNVLDIYVEIPVEDILPVISEVTRILKPTGSLWIAMGWNSLRFWENAAAQCNLHQLGHVIWKYQFGVYTKKRPVSSHYHLLVFTKSKHTWTWNQQGYDEDVWIINRPYQVGGLKYPNKLPEEIALQMIIRSSNPGDIVVDPFAGSGTIVKVAQQNDRIGIGSDLVDCKIFWENS